MDELKYMGAREKSRRGSPDTESAQAGFKGSESVAKKQRD